MRKWSQTDKFTEENLSQKLYLLSIAKNKDPSIRVKMHQTLFLFLPLFALHLMGGCDLFHMSCLSEISLMVSLDISKNKIMKIEQKKILCGPSKMLKNISWPINICLKNFMVPTKTLPPFLVNMHGLFLWKTGIDYKKGIDYRFVLWNKTKMMQLIYLIFLN